MATKTSDSESNELDDEKEEYLRLVKYNFHSNNFLLQHPCIRSDVNSMISRVKSKAPDRYATKYEVIKKNGEDILIKKRNNKDNEIIQILPAEDCFEVIMEIHKVGHVGTLDISESLTRNKKIICPPNSLPLALQCCRYCKNLKPNQRVQLYLAEVLHEMSTQIRVFYGCVLIYIDKATNYTLLRPLLKKSDLEVSLELYKIFAEFGPPQTLEITTYSDNMSFEVDKLLMEICPQFSVHIEKKPPTCASAIVTTNFVKKELIEWMSETKNGNWEVGCFILQRKMNSTPNSKQRNINRCIPPRKAYFAEQNFSFDDLFKFDKGNSDVDDLNYKDSENDSTNTMTVPEIFDIELDGIDDSERTKVLTEVILLDENSSEAITVSTSSVPKNTNLQRNIDSVETEANMSCFVHRAPRAQDEIISKVVPLSKDLYLPNDLNDDTKDILTPESIFLVQDNSSVQKALIPETTNIGESSVNVSKINTPVNVLMEENPLNVIEPKLENLESNALNKTSEDSLIDTAMDEDDDVDFGAGI